MAIKRFLVVEDSFIGMRLIRAEDKKVVEIETDPDKGGMIPGTNLAEVDENDNLIGAPEESKGAKSARKKKEDSSDLA